MRVSKSRRSPLQICWRWRSGLDCGFLPGEQELEQMRRTSEWVKFALALPMKYTPGEKFGYCSPGYHLLSSVVTAVAHEPLAEFGKKNLFAPLGIHDVIWPPDEQGRTHGWGDSHFYPRDFGKIGYLFLHDGQWEGKLIVPSEWIHQSITRQSDPGRGNDSGYGYGWWLSKIDGVEEFGGNGRGGQTVAVWPEKDMIVIITGGGYPANEVRPAIAKSIQADHALAANPAAVRELKVKIAEGNPSSGGAAKSRILPAMAHTDLQELFINFLVMPRGLMSFLWLFSGGKDAQLKLKYSVERILRYQLASMESIGSVRMVR